MSDDDNSHPNQISAKEAESRYNNGETIYFADGRDATTIGLKESAVPVSNKDGTCFLTEVQLWYTFNHWGTLKPRLVYLSSI